MNRLAIIALLLLPVMAIAQKYRITWKKVGAWTAYGVSGGLHGGREALHADPYVFEKKWGVGSRSFFGSDQWMRQYEGNDPERAHRWNALNFTRDYWHMSHVAGQYIRDGATFSIGCSQQPMKYKVADLLIGMAVSSATSWASYNYLRR